MTTLVCQSVDLAITKACNTFCPPLTAPASKGATRSGIATVCTPTAIVDPIPAGSDFEYDITVTNNDGSVTAHSVVLDDALPAGVSFVSVFPNPCVSGTIPANTCNLGDIGPGSSVSFSVHVKAINSGPVTNTASVSATECDRNTDDNSSSCSVTVQTDNMPTALEADREGCTNVSSPFCTGDADSIATVSDINRVFEPNETVRVDPAWTNTISNDDPDVTGTASNFVGPTGATYLITDTTADYGAIKAGQQSDCNGVTATSPNSTGTGDCYGFQALQTDPLVRPTSPDRPTTGTPTSTRRSRRARRLPGRSTSVTASPTSRVATSSIDSSRRSSTTASRKGEATPASADSSAPGRARCVTRWPPSSPEPSTTARTA